MKTFKIVIVELLQIFFKDNQPKKKQIIRNSIILMILLCIIKYCLVETTIN